MLEDRKRMIPTISKIKLSAYHLKPYLYRVMSKDFGISDSTKLNFLHEKKLYQNLSEICSILAYDLQTWSSIIEGIHNMLTPWGRHIQIIEVDIRRKISPAQLPVLFYI